MLTLKGKSVFRGIAIGSLALFHRHAVATAPRTVTDSGAEIARFRAARQASLVQLQELYDKALEKVGEEQAAVFEVHQMMLDDDEYIEAVETKIRDGNLNAEAAVDRAAQEFAALFRNMDDDYMKARAADVLDISHRVLVKLCGGQAIDYGQYDGVILAADDLAPSETLQLDTDKILGFVTSGGSTNSHTAILARTLGIAAVVGTGTQLPNDVDGHTAIIDGTTGMVYLDPDETTLARLQAAKMSLDAQQAALEEVRGLPSVTRDGRRIHVYANIGSPDDLPQAQAHDAEGIGLFRSEFLYLGKTTIRRKKNSSRPTSGPPKPWTGNWRSSGPWISAPTKSRLLRPPRRRKSRPGPAGHPPLPDAARPVQDAAPRPVPRVGLRQPCRHVSHDYLCRRSAALQSPAGRSTARTGRRGPGVRPGHGRGHHDRNPGGGHPERRTGEGSGLFSIGSNDLTQYTLAIDRQQTQLDDFFDPHHPAVLRLLAQTIANGHKAGIWVGICGELGADLSLTETFLRMGVDELSVSPPSILPLRAKIRSLDLSQGCRK